VAQVTLAEGPRSQVGRPAQTATSPTLERDTSPHRCCIPRRSSTTPPPRPTWPPNWASARRPQPRADWGQTMRHSAYRGGAAFDGRCACGRMPRCALMSTPVRRG